MAFPAPSNTSRASLPLPHPAAYEGEPREYARALMQHKDAVEREIDALKEVLTSQGITASTSLFDPEGFPRSDIDVYSIRHTRAAIARLHTDRATLADLLAPALEAAFAAPSGSGSGSGLVTGQPNGHAHAPSPSLPNGHAPHLAAAHANGDAISSRAPHPYPHLHTDQGRTDVDLDADWPAEPVARVNSVDAASPAHEAGLRAGDAIHAFGDVVFDQRNGRGLGAIGSLVVRSEGVVIPLKVVRGTERVRLSLTPRSGWGGRGSLGCHILPP